MEPSHFPLMCMHKKLELKYLLRKSLYRGLFPLPQEWVLFEEDIYLALRIPLHHLVTTESSSFYFFSLQLKALEVAQEKQAQLVLL